MNVSVVVANHGRDLSVLKASLPKHVEFIEVSMGKERSFQRNFGIRQATGDIILWLDSDQSVSPYLISEIEDLMSAGFSALYIPEVIIAKSFFGRIRAFEREFYTGTAVDVPRAVKRSICPLFDETLHGPEDADFGQVIKRRSRLIGTTERVLYHHDDISPIEYFKKKAYYAKSMKRYKEKWPNDKCLDANYRCWTVFVENGKWRKILRHPLLSIGVFLIIAVRALIYLRNK